MRSGLPASLYTEPASTVVEVWTFMLKDGTRHWSTGPSITSGATTWVAGPTISRGTFHSSVGLDPATIDITLAGEVYEGGPTVVEAACSLAFDGVRAIQYRALLDDAGAVTALVQMFDGYVQGSRPETGQVRLTIGSLMTRAQQRSGSRRCQTHCPFAVYSAECGALEQFHQSTFQLVAGSTDRVLQLSPSLLLVPGALTNVVVGSVVQLAGNSYTVIDVGNGIALTIDGTTGTAPPAGAQVVISRGCDKTLTTCRDRFDNARRYGGCPFQPAKDL